MNELYTSGYDAILEYVNGGRTAKTITRTNDHIQYSHDDITIVIGFNSLRMIIVDNDKAASITMVPAAISVGSLSLDCETTFALYNTEYRHTFGGLYIDGGETFQNSTVYDFDFGIVKSIVPKYLQVLEAMSLSPEMKPNVHATTLANAIENVRKYNKMYEQE